jgi:hypothetical protein
LSARSFANVLRRRRSRATALFGHEDRKRHSSMNSPIEHAAGTIGVLMDGKPSDRASRQRDEPERLSQRRLDPAGVFVPNITGVAGGNRRWGNATPRNIGDHRGQ